MWQGRGRLGRQAHDIDLALITRSVVDDGFNDSIVRLGWIFKAVFYSGA